MFNPCIITPLLNLEFLMEYILNHGLGTKTSAHMPSSVGL